MIFGIVEGITEWLSVSSTGHMILLDEFVKLQGSDSFVNVFLVVIQLGALLAVVVLFWDQLFPFQFRDRRKPVLDRGKMAMWGGKIIIACIPAAVEGVLFDSTFEALFYHAVPVALALIVFEIAFIVIESRTEGRQPRITFSNLLMILVSIIVFLALGYLWLSNHSLAEIKEAADILAKEGLKISAIQNHYSLLNRSSETSGILDYCKENDIIFFSYMVLEQGALTGKYDTEHPFPADSDRGRTYNPMLPTLEKLNKELEKIADRHHVATAQIPVA